MNDKEDRIAKLSQRFRTHATGRPKSSLRNRERQSFYLDAELTEQIDQIYKEVAHELYPRAISKSMFLETVLEHGLENMTAIKSRLSKIEDTAENS